MIPQVRMAKVRNLKPFLEKHGMRNVVIVTNQWGGYWRTNRCGYTDDISQAGIYTLNEAWDATSHCGAEKAIFYKFLKQ